MASLLELQSCLGFKTPARLEPLVEQHRRADYLGLCQTIAAQMQLPNEIRLVSVSRASPFRSSALSPTDDHGRGTHGIVAQVAASDSLPLYGTAVFQAYVIDIAVGPGFGEVSPATAITVVAHELSHVLLYSLKYPHRDSEHVTDLVPIALGFGEVVRAGRRVQVSEQHGDQIITTTTSYGYLNDAEFEEAAGVVGATLEKRQRQLAAFRRLLSRAARCRERTLCAIQRSIDLLDEMDRCPGHVRSADAYEIVRLHAPMHFDERRAAVESICDSRCRDSNTLDPARAYTSAMAASLDDAIRSCKQGLTLLSDVARQTDLEERVLLRNSPWRARMSGQMRRILKKPANTRLQPTAAPRAVSRRG